MLYMNDYDMHCAREAAINAADMESLPRAVRILTDLMNETDSHSDGWAHWRAPCAAAAKLMALVQAPGRLVSGQVAVPKPCGP